MNIFIYIAVMALTTYLIRLLPMTIFRTQITNRFVRSFLYYVPYACLAAMTFPAMVHDTDHLLSAILGSIAACVLAYFKKSLIVVAASTCAVVLVTELAYTLI
ncbi:MAG: AzlD domain-containing protein [Clostridia bacterium]|nr:AzlD domain-containing protein [Clostridia bacterium]